MTFFGGVSDLVIASDVGNGWLCLSISASLLRKYTNEMDYWFKRFVNDLLTYVYDNCNWMAYAQCVFYVRSFVVNYSLNPHRRQYVFISQLFWNSFDTLAMYAPFKNCCSCEYIRLHISWTINDSKQAHFCVHIK